jgi:glycosyltransferase involved in cell wall biosynthesis
MNVLIVGNKIPAIVNNGTEKVIWYLGKELIKLGHKVSYLVERGSSCNFAKIYIRDAAAPLEEQIPEDTDIVHFNINNPPATIKPYIITEHGLITHQRELDKNSVFVSKKHAELCGSSQFVYNGLDWDDYGEVDFNKQRAYFHFLGNAAWRIKNLKGAIKTVLSVPKEKLAVLGGNRIEWSRRFRFTLSSRVNFYGFVGGQRKLELLNGSKGLIHPIKAHESFGLALTESLYFGCPVFGTPYGSLPEIVTKDFGFLSAKSAELAQAIKNANAYDRKKCHEYARDCFNSKKMALEYLKKYETVLSGKTLNSIPPKLKEKQAKRFLPWE